MWCQFGCPIELMRNQGKYFINKVIEGLTYHYAIVHKKSTPYYPQANEFVGINKQNAIDNTKENCQSKQDRLGH